MLSGDTEGIQVIFLCAEAFPSIPLFSLLKIRALLNSGKSEEARRWASAIMSHIPLDEVFATAEGAVHAIMD
jgi:hypothetical protein